MGGFGTVSYTHLDVYKRQDLTYQAEHAVVNLRVGRNEEAIQILNNILKADPKSVSYTHLYCTFRCGSSLCP